MNYTEHWLEICHFFGDKLKILLYLRTGQLDRYNELQPSGIPQWMKKGTSYIILHSFWPIRDVPWEPVIWFRILLVCLWFITCIPSDVAPAAREILFRLSIQSVACFLIAEISQVAKLITNYTIHFKAKEKFSKMGWALTVMPALVDQSNLCYL